MSDSSWLTIDNGCPRARTNKFMEKHAFLRSDGKRALILQTVPKWLTSSEFPEAKRKKYKETRKSGLGSYFVRGANILKGEEYEKYYSGRTGQRIKLDEVEYINGGIKLRPENTVDIYADYDTTDDDGY